MFLKLAQSSTDDGGGGGFLGLFLMTDVDSLSSHWSEDAFNQSICFPFSAVCSIMFCV